MRIDADAARPFFAHPSQWKYGRPEQLHDEGHVYYATGPACLVFYDMPWPRVLGVHCAVKPEGWGRAVEPVTHILRFVWDEMNPALIAGWVNTENRAMLSFARRCGFEKHGAMPVGVEMLHWRP